MAETSLILVVHMAASLKGVKQLGSLPTHRFFRAKEDKFFPNIPTVLPFAAPVHVCKDGAKPVPE
jgi:hypothetical protein